MTPFPLGLDSPGKRLASTLQDRSAARLMAIIAEHHLRGVGRYMPRDVTGDGHAETWCNVFLQDVAEAMSAMVPRGRRANELVQWFSAAEARSQGWEQVDEHTAQRMADEGQLAVGVWFNRNGGPGHVCVMAPSLGEPGAWCAQAGRTNFTRAPVGAGFGGLPITYFAHP